MEKSQKDSADHEHKHNPFSVHDMLEAVNKACEKNLRLQKEKEKRLKVHEKGTTLTKIRSSTMTVRSLRLQMEEAAQEAIALAKDKTPGFVESEYILDLIKDTHRLGEKSAAEYVARNKTILLSDHALKIKQRDIQRMKDLADKLEAQVLEDEKKLERDAHNFDKFIKHINICSSSAVEKLKEKIKLKFKRMEEVRRLKADIFLLESQITKLESQLSEYVIYANFLEAANPQSKERETLKYKPDDQTGLNPSGGQADDLLGPIEIPYSNESELLKAINCFRDQNLNIVTNSHYIRKTLIAAQATYNSVEEKMTDDLQMYSKKIICLQNDIKNNRERTKKFEELSVIASKKGLEEEKQFKKVLEPVVASTYKMCTGIKGGKMSLMMMITAIESYLSELLFEIYSLPEKAIAKVYASKQLERKGRKRREEKELRARIQKERIKKTEQLRREPAKLKLQRRLLYQPQTTKQVLKKEDKVAEETAKHEDEDYAYFFS